jgi:two-component system cell cycle response regulator
MTDANAVRILVIEDNPTNLELMIYLLKAFGYEVLSATDGEAGFDLVRRVEPALIICDIGLPKMDGYALCAQLKKHPALREIPLVAVTALAMVGDRDKVLAAGFDGYIAKPITPETFVSQVEKFLRSNQRPTQRPASPISSEQIAPKRPHRGTILAVDNVAANLELDKSILEPFGYQVITADNVRDALELAREKHPDLILSDLNMPGRDGFDLIKSIRDDSELRSIIIVIHSASMISEQDRERALALGADQFIRRPLEPQVLLDVIEANLKTHDTKHAK